MIDETDDSEAATLAYAQRPRPMAATLEMRLTPHRLEAQRGSTRIDFPFGDIERIALFFRPRNAAHRAFACKVRAKNGRSLIFDTLSWRATFEVEKQDGAYAAFVRALVSRAAAANPAVAIIGGVSPVRFWLTAVVGGAMAIALAIVAINALTNGAWPLALLTLGFALYLAWWLNDFLRRNRPRRLAAEALPPELVPAASGANHQH